VPGFSPETPDASPARAGGLGWTPLNPSRRGSAGSAPRPSRPERWFRWLAVAAAESRFEAMFARTPANLMRIANPVLGSPDGRPAVGVTAAAADPYD